MYKFAFWVMVSAILIISYGMLKTGGAVFPRLQSLEYKIDQTNKRADIYFYANRYEIWLSQIK